MRSAATAWPTSPPASNPTSRRRRPEPWPWSSSPARAPASAGRRRALAARGDSITLVARGRDGLAAAADDVAAAGGRPLVVTADVADPDAMEEAARVTEDELGPIDAWINNAMVSVFSPVSELTAEEVRRVTEVTYLGAVHGTLAALHAMRPRDRGTIVQVGSALAYRAIPLQAAYCGAKHAIEGFTESLRCELRSDGPTGAWDASTASAMARARGGG